MADEIVFEGRGLHELANDLRHAARGVRRETDKTLLTVGTEVMEAAKAIASQHSQTIPATIKMRVLPGMVVIRAGSQGVPIAALDELGNKGSKVTATSFRHPVFGNRDVWVDQPKHPFLRPALAADRRSITRRMEQTWDRALAPHRLKPEG